MKTVKILSVLLVALMLCTMLAACGGSPEEKAAVGTYQGQYTKFVGDPDDVTDTDPFTLELKSGGKGTHHRDDLDIDVTWTIEGEKFTMQETFMGITIDYTGTLKDGKLDIFNGDPSDIWSCEYVYEKQ